MYTFGANLHKCDTFPVDLIPQQVDKLGSKATGYEFESNPMGQFMRMSKSDNLPLSVPEFQQFTIPRTGRTFVGNVSDGYERSQEFIRMSQAF
ncbi:hypothetical protein SK128_027411 [Halocaridina rubra]|uniref:Uncharacterized protein n=1 Tax=Halocaridina rubra TaxID=373956 RepID=A0AAN8XA36_HALRR